MSPEKADYNQSVVSSCRVPLITQAYFQQLLPLSECIPEDGKLVAQMLMDVVESNPKHPARAIRTFVNRTAMLRECGLRHFGDLLVALLVTSDGQGAPEHGPVVLRDSPSLVLNNDPALLTEEQATIIGSTFAAQLRSSHTPAATLLKVVKLNPVLSLLKSKFPWFVPMFECIVKCRHAGTHRASAFNFRRFTTLVAPELAGTSPIASPIDEVCEFTSVVRPSFQCRLQIGAPRHRATLVCRPPLSKSSIKRRAQCPTSPQACLPFFRRQFYRSAQPKTALGRPPNAQTCTRPALRRRT
jgi:hypothetical protein